MTWKQPESKWDTGEDYSVAKECSWGDKYTGITFYIMPEVWSVITQLCDDVKSEWQMMLCGEEHDDNIIVTGYWIPKQEVTMSTVTNVDLIDSQVVREKKIVATIHSHANMGVFFSSTDTEFTNMSLIKNHIVVNNKGETCGTTRHSLPCGFTRFFDCKIEVHVEKADVVGRENITEKKYFYQGVGYGSDVNKNWDTDKRKMKGKKGKKNKKRHAILEEDENGLYQGVGV